MSGKVREPASDRFWRKVTHDGPINTALGTACWLWLAQVNPEGYGRFWLDGAMRPAHRVAYEMTYGPLTSDNCDHHYLCPKSCVNPAHLRPASQKQNQENRVGARRDSKTGVRGVWLIPSSGRYRAAVRHQGLSIDLGTFPTLSKAEEAVVIKRRELYSHNDADGCLLR